jgi:hypothetical protein
MANEKAAEVTPRFKPIQAIARAGAWSALVIAGFICSAAVRAEADGPDYYRVKGVADGQSLPLLSTPQAGSQTIGHIPAAAQCLKNLGCNGGLSLEEFTSLSKAAQQQRLQENPRWCKVEYQGRTGWVNGGFVTESACPGQPPVAKDSRIDFPSGKSVATAKGRIRGYETASYLVRVRAGQKLLVSLAAKHPQLYFNVLHIGSQEALFVGSSSGNQMERVMPADGDYQVQVYFMRAAARRGSAGNFEISVRLTGEGLKPIAASQDALVAGTPFHATAKVACRVPYAPDVTTCDAGVVRRGLDASATVELRWSRGVRHILLVKGAVIASDSAQPTTSARSGDSTMVRIGEDETFEIPDPLLTGG